MTKFQPLIQRFMSYVLILTGTVLLINYFKKTTAPDWNDAVLWIAIANLVLGLAVYISGFLARRNALRAIEQED